jgi:hypothetical protein
VFLDKVIMAVLMLLTLGLLHLVVAVQVLQELQQL